MDEPQSWDALIGRGDYVDPDSMRGRFDWHTLRSAALTVALTFVLILQLTFIGLDETQDLSFWDITGSSVTAAIIIGVQVALLVRAKRLGRRGLQVISVLALVIAVAMVALLWAPLIIGTP